MSFSFSYSNWKGAALAAESFLILVAVTGSQYTTAGFASELAAVALGEEGVPPTGEADRTIRWLLYLWSWSLEPEEWRRTRQPDERRVRNRCQHRQEAPPSEMGLGGRYSSPYCLSFETHLLHVLSGPVRRVEHKDIVCMPVSVMTLGLLIAQVSCAKSFT